MSRWSDDKIQTVTRMWNEEYTASEIGEAIGMSRNAVLGKVGRLNLPARVNPIMTRDEIFKRVVDRMVDAPLDAPVTLREAADLEHMPRMTALKMWNALKANMGPTAI